MEHLKATIDNWSELVVDGFESMSSTKEVEWIPFMNIGVMDGEFAMGQVIATGKKGTVISIRFNTRKGFLEAYSSKWCDVTYADSWKELVQNMQAMQQDFNFKIQ